MISLTEAREALRRAKAHAPSEASGATVGADSASLCNAQRCRGLNVTAKQALVELRRENAALRRAVEVSAPLSTAENSPSMVVVALQEENGALRERIAQLEDQLEHALLGVRAQCDATAVTQARVMSKLQRIQEAVDYPATRHPPAHR